MAGRVSVRLDQSRLSRSSETMLRPIFLDALEKVRPDIRSIIAFQNEALSITRTQKK